MQIVRLTLQDFRCFKNLEWSPASGLNLVTGENGTGKTSLLEAMHLMAYGRSFRGRVRDGLVRQDAEALEVFVEWSEKGAGGSEAGESSAAGLRRAGMRHGGQNWTGRLDGRTVSQMGDLCAALAVVTFEPGSHSLISGGSEYRRRFMDWGLFHVEQTFLALWRRYSRALKQRNALLKTKNTDMQLDVWDRELSEAGEALTRHRQRYLDQLQERLLLLAPQLSSSVEILSLEFSPGWRRQEMVLGDALLLSRDRDRQMGHTTTGPHRADWSLHFGSLPGREALSRGQAKLAALSCLLSQAEDYAQRFGEWPVVVLDDLASELDTRHQAHVLSYLQQRQAQTFITATEMLSMIDEVAPKYALFHVEHGQLRSKA
ncbi:MAG: DNA replication/repair protein RecF [Xanthomonadaceae bacterium]|nr:DNA replication/repair protein RecF [Xanthomonadaceae bacterium]